ncbi:MAG: hypothetical protein E6J70_03835, partial [Deltaproteobacteria bacterium]
DDRERHPPIGRSAPYGGRPVRAPGLRQGGWASMSGAARWAKPQFARHRQRVLAESATLEEAATRLGINSTTLWRKRKRWGLD